MGTRWAAVAAGAVLAVSGCGTTTAASGRPQDPNLATSAPVPGGGSSPDEACSLVSAGLVRSTLGVRTGGGKRSLKTTDLSVCEYKPSTTTFVLVQSTHRADAFFPATLYPPQGKQTTPVPGAERGYASVVTGSGLTDPDQLLVVKGTRGVQVSVAVKGDYTTDDLVALGRKILAEL